MINLAENVVWPAPQEWQAVRLSLLVAGAATAATLPPGVLLGWLLARRGFRGKWLVETLVTLPLVLPPVVVGYALLVTFGSRGPVGSLLESLGLRVVFTWVGAALAAAVVSFPLVVRSARVAFAGIDPLMEQAARNLGAGGFATFRRVTLPLAYRGVIAGGVLAFARALGEFGATIMIAGNIPGRTRTIPLFVYTLLQTPGGDVRAIRIVLISVLLAAGALLVSEWLDRRAVAYDAPPRRRSRKGASGRP